MSGVREEEVSNGKTLSACDGMSVVSQCKTDFETDKVFKITHSLLSLSVQMVVLQG